MNKIFGIVIMLAGAFVAFYHLFFIVPGVCEKLSDLATYATTASDHLAGMGGVFLLIGPLGLASVLVWYGLRLSKTQQ